MSPPRVAMIAACCALSLGLVARADARPYPTGLAMPAQHASAEADPLPGSAWAEERRLADYLYLHRVAGQCIITVYPLGAPAGATRRADPAEGASPAYRLPATSRRTAAAPAGGRAQSSY